MSGENSISSPGLDLEEEANRHAAGLSVSVVGRTHTSLTHKYVVASPFIGNGQRMPYGYGEWTNAGEHAQARLRLFAVLS